MERSEPERGGSMLEEFWLREWKRKSWTSNKVEVWKREAFIGRGAPLEWRRVRKNKKHIGRMWCEDCWARNFSLSGEYNLQRLQSRQDELARRRDEAAKRNEYHEGCDEEDQI